MIDQSGEPEQLDDVVQSLNFRLLVNLAQLTKFATLIYCLILLIHLLKMNKTKLCLMNRVLQATKFRVLQLPISLFVP